MRRGRMCIAAAATGNGPHRHRRNPLHPGLSFDVVLLRCRPSPVRGPSGPRSTSRPPERRCWRSHRTGHAGTDTPVEPNRSKARAGHVLSKVIHGYRLTGGASADARHPPCPATRASRSMHAVSIDAGVIEVRGDRTRAWAIPRNPGRCRPRSRRLGFIAYNQGGPGKKCASGPLPPPRIRSMHGYRERMNRMIRRPPQSRLEPRRRRDGGMAGWRDGGMAG